MEKLQDKTVKHSTSLESRTIFSNKHQIQIIRIEREVEDCVVQLLCSKWVQLQSITQGCVQSGLEYCQGWWSCSISGQFVPLFYHCHYILKWNFLSFNSCPLHLVLSLGIAEKSLTQFSDLPVRYLYTLTGSPLRILFCRLSSHSSLSFSLCQMAQALIGLLAFCWTCSSASMPCCYWGAQN